MTPCTHSETTAVLAAFGEAPADFEQHLSTCDACQQVVAEHSQTVALIAPVMADRGPAEPATNSRGWHPVAAIMLLAAAVLLMVSGLGIGTDAGQARLDSPLHTASPDGLDAAFTGFIDSDIDALEMDLALLDME
jgi:hypothetical protein